MVDKAKRKTESLHEENAKKIVIDVLDKGLLNLSQVGILASALSAAGNVDCGNPPKDICPCGTKCDCSGVDRLWDIADPELQEWVRKMIKEEINKKLSKG